MKKVVIVSSILWGICFTILYLLGRNASDPSHLGNVWFVGGMVQASAAIASVVFLISYGIGAGVVKYRQRRQGY